MSDEWINATALRLMRNCSTDTAQEYDAIADARTALREAEERGKAAAAERERGAMSIPRNAETMLQVASIMETRALVAEAKLARLREPDEEMVQAATHAWMNRDLSDPDSNPMRDMIRALADHLDKPQPNKENS